MSEDISNRTLAGLMVVAMFISLGGLAVSVADFGDLGSLFSITGAATTDVGNVSISVQGFNSITTVTRNINFGSCQPAASGGTNITSNATATPTECSGGNYPGNITIRNDGNQEVNVTFTSSVLASSFIGGTSPAMWYATNGSFDSNGCFNSSVRCVACTCGQTNGDNCTYQYNWTPIESTSVGYNACSNLSVNGQFDLFMKIFIPSDAPSSSDSNVTLTFTANAFP